MGHHGLAIYRLEGGRYGRPIYQELKGQTLLSAVLGVSIDWDRMMTRLVDAVPSS